MNFSLLGQTFVAIPTYVACHAEFILVKTTDTSCINANFCTGRTNVIFVQSMWTFDGMASLV